MRTETVARETISPPLSSYAAHLPYTLHARLHATPLRTAADLRRLMLDRRLRAALALNLITHALLTALAWALIRALNL